MLIYSHVSNSVPCCEVRPIFQEKLTEWKMHWYEKPDVIMHAIIVWWVAQTWLRGDTLSIHYNDVIMTTIASAFTSLTVVYSPVYSDVDQRKHQSSASLAFVRGIHRDRWIPRTKGQLRGKCFHLMTSSCWYTSLTKWWFLRFGTKQSRDNASVWDCLPGQTQRLNEMADILPPRLHCILSWEKKKHSRWNCT